MLSKTVWCWSQSCNCYLIVTLSPLSLCTYEYCMFDPATRSPPIQTSITIAMPSRRFPPEKCSLSSSQLGRNLDTITRTRSPLDSNNLSHMPNASSQIFLLFSRPVLTWESVYISGRAPYYNCNHCPHNCLVASWKTYIMRSFFA